MTPPDPSLILYMADDFDGAAFNPTKYIATDGTMFSGYGQEKWAKDHVSVANGLLKLSATADMYSGELRSTFSIPLPAYLEVRAMNPSSHPGLWPAALWTLGVVANSAQEVDIDESDSSDGHRIGLNLHGGSQGNSPASNGAYSSASVDFTQGFHVYGAWIGPDRVEFYVDDVLCLTRMYSDIGFTFTDPVQLRFSLSIFGPKQSSHLSPTSTTAWPADLLIDWWRAWIPAPIDPTVPTDTESPTVSFSSPNGGAVTRGSTTVVKINANDNQGVSKVELYINGTRVNTFTSLPYNYNWKVPGKPNAHYTLMAKAFDAAGNTGAASIAVTAR